MVRPTPTSTSSLAGDQEQKEQLGVPTSTLTSSLAGDTKQERQSARPTSTSTISSASGPRAAKKAKPEPKQRELEQYGCLTKGMRQKVNPESKAEMRQMLEEWRAHHPNSRTTRTNEHRPDDREYYVMARRTLIGKGLLTRLHGDLVVRTCMQNFCRAEALTDNAAQDVEAEARASGDEDDQ